jgi:hypothetical protein
VEPLGPLLRDDPTLIGSYRLKARLSTDAHSVTYLARSAGGRDVSLRLLGVSAAEADAAGALYVGSFGKQTYIVTELAEALPEPRLKRSRDWGTSLMVWFVALVFLLSAIVIGYLWYYNIGHKPLRHHPHRTPLSLSESRPQWTVIARNQSFESAIPKSRSDNS